MTRREFLRRTAPMIVAGTLPLSGAHALWSKFFPEPKGWDGRPRRKSVAVIVEGWNRYHSVFPEDYQQQVCRSLQVPREYLFGNVDSQTVAEMARRMGIPLSPVRLPMVDRAFESQKRMEVEVFRREYQRKFDDKA